MAPCRPSCRRRRVRKALLLLILVLSSAPRPPLSHSSELRLRVPPKESCYDYERSYAREQLRYQLRSLLLTPTFMLYLVLMAWLALLFTLALLDIFLKIVCTSCSGVVKLLTPCSLPAVPRGSVLKIER